MKKMNNTRKGFTLVEMVCVIAMIVLFSSVLFTNVVEYNATANRAADKVQEHELNNARAEDDVKSYLVGYTRQPAASATSATIDETRPGTAAPDAGGGQNATTIDVEAPDATIPHLKQRPHRNRRLLLQPQQLQLQQTAEPVLGHLPAAERDQRRSALRMASIQKHTELQSLLFRVMARHTVSR